jgi:hypothetical protein
VLGERWNIAMLRGASGHSSRYALSTSPARASFSNPRRRRRPRFPVFLDEFSSAQALHLFFGAFL